MHSCFTCPNVLPNPCPCSTKPTHINKASLQAVCPPLPPCPWAALWCHHSQEVPYKVSHREREKKSVREGDKQWQLRWEFEMAYERNGVKEDILFRNLLCFLSSAPWLTQTLPPTHSLTSTPRKLHLQLICLSATHGPLRNFPLCRQHNSTLMKPTYYYEITMNPLPSAGRVESAWKQLYRQCKWFIHYGGHSIDCPCLLR